jgi:hypothetical protein
MCIFGLLYYRQRRKSRQHTCAWSLVWIGSERWVGSWSVWTPTIIPCSLGMTSVATRQSSTVRIVSRVFFRSAASRGCIQTLQLVGSLQKITLRHKIRYSDYWKWKLLKWPKFSCFCWKIVLQQTKRWLRSCREKNLKWNEFTFFLYHLTTLPWLQWYCFRTTK